MSSLWSPWSQTRQPLALQSLRPHKASPVLTVPGLLPRGPSLFCGASLSRGSKYGTCSLTEIISSKRGCFLSSFQAGADSSVLEGARLTGPSGGSRKALRNAVTRCASGGEGLPGLPPGFPSPRPRYYRPRGFSVAHLRPAHGLHTLVPALGMWLRAWGWAPQP